MNSEYFPQPFFITNGEFSFKEEKPVIKLRRGTNNQPLQEETAESDDDQNGGK